MVPYGEMCVVRLQGVGWSSEENTDVVSVVATSVEVRVVADLQGQMCRDVAQRDQSLLLERVVQF